jgi:hypothetical protein
MNNKDQEQIHKLHIGNVKYIRNMLVNISLYYEEKITKHFSGSNIYKYQSTIIDNNTKEEVGYFLIQGNGYRQFYETTPDMTIHLNPEWRGGGLSRLLIFLCTSCMIYENKNKNKSKSKSKSKSNLLDRDPLIYIDVDGSGIIDTIREKSFWDLVGMEKSRYVDTETTRNIQGVGYEKQISFRKLHAFGMKHTVDIEYIMKILNGSGKKQKYKKKQTKKKIQRKTNIKTKIKANKNTAKR